MSLFLVFNLEPGYRDVKFTFCQSSIDRTCIEDLRHRVSAMTFCPPWNILLKSVDTVSGTVELSMPDLYVGILAEEIVKPKESVNLFGIGVEVVDVDSPKPVEGGLYAKKIRPIWRAFVFIKIRIQPFY